MRRNGSSRALVAKAGIGASGSVPPSAEPAVSATPYRPASTPAARSVQVAAEWPRVCDHRSQARISAGTAHNESATRSGTMRASIHAASASIITPKSFFTRSIQGPALGSSRPAEAPTTSNGVPMPTLMANSAAPPRDTCPLWLITSSAPTSAGPTQVVTIRAESAPMTAAPPKVPADWRLLMLAMRVWMATGICSVNSPSIESASTTNRAANSVSTHHCWNTACTCRPAAAQAMPARV